MYSRHHMVLPRWSVLLPLVLCPQHSSWGGLAWRGVGVFSLRNPQVVPGEGERDVPPPCCRCGASSSQFWARSISTPSCPIRSRPPTGKDPARNYKPLRVGACSHWKAERYAHAKRIAIYPSFSYLFCPLWQHQLQTTGFEFVAFGLPKVTALSV